MPPRPVPNVSPRTLEIIDEVREEDATSSLEFSHDELLSRNQDDQSFHDTEIAVRNREATDRLIAELNGETVARGKILEVSASRMRAIHAVDPLERIRELHRGMDEVLGIDPRGGDPVVNRLVADDAAMSSGIDRGSAATDGCIRFVMILCGFAVVGVFGLMIFSIIKACESPAELSKSADQPLDHSPLGHRIVNLTSMVMEAAADRPGCFQELGVTDECYGQVRQAVVDGQGNVPESLWWQLLADQAQQPYPQTDILFTPANHYMALAFCLDVLQPLYSPQPFDLDVDQTIEALASTLNLNDPTCMAGYYSHMLEMIPEETAINRAQRIFLARAGLARAFSRWRDSQT